MPSSVFNTFWGNWGKTRGTFPLVMAGQQPVHRVRPLAGPMTSSDGRERPYVPAIPIEIAGTTPAMTP